MKNLPLLLIILSLTSCMPAILYFSGIRPPREETPQSIMNYAKKMNQDIGDIYILKDSSCYARMMEDSLISKNLFSAVIFNKLGLITSYRDSSSCQWSAARYIKNMKPDSSWIINKNYNSDKILKNIIPINGNTYPVFDTAKYDFLVIYTWAKFITKMNERLFLITQAVRENPNAKFMIVSLNVDMQESWKLNKDQRVIIQP